MHDSVSETLLYYRPHNRKTRKRSRMRKMVEILPYSLLFCFLVGFVLGVRHSAASDHDLGDDDSNFDVKDLNKTWTYECINSQCQRRIFGGTKITSLKTCNMICAAPSLWPIPKYIKSKNKTSSTISINQMVAAIVASNGVEKDLNIAFGIFKQNLPSAKGKGREAPDAKSIRIEITIHGDERRLKLSTKESYSLSVQLSSTNTILVNITAPTYFGARHALETLSQLIWWDTSTGEHKILHNVIIEDAPAFPYRGVMVDTARNFFSIGSILKVVDGMSASKLNVLHLHLTDAVSFPVVLPTLPELAKYGAYGADKIYTPGDIKGLIEYARIRGIRTILEVDSPSHVNEGWNYFNKDEEKLVICGETEVSSGQLNPDNPKSLKLLKTVYGDLFELGTDDEIFHVGGDEVNLACYARTKASKKFRDMYYFWAHFTNDIIESVASIANSPPNYLVLWSSPLTDHYLNNLNYSRNLVVQYWYGQLDPIVKNGNKIIFSTVGRWYLDCGFGPWQPNKQSGACDPYTPWQIFYKYQPWNENRVPKDQVLGGEACLWTEQVDESTLETRLWPRAAAFAERVWSDPDIFDSYDVSTRISTHRDRLMERGFEVAAIWPLWCTHNPGKC